MSPTVTKVRDGHAATYLPTMKIIAALLIVVGLVGLVYGGFRVAYPDNIIDAGALQVTVTKHKSLPIPPILGAVSLMAGIGLLLVDRKR